MPEKNKSNELRITRILNAPVKLVWNAWTDVDQVSEWWGPRGFSITTHSKELRVGGHWAYTMHGPDGVNYENKTIYHEVEENRKLVYDHGGNDDRPPLFRVTVTFLEKNSQTEMRMVMRFDTPEITEKMKAHIKEAGGNSTWDRLSEYVTKVSTGKSQFVMNRSFKISQESMYEMWTNPELFSKWLPPTGMSMEFFRADVKTGGSSFYRMSGPGLEMYGRVHYLKFEKPDRIFYSQEFTDKDEKVSRHPFAPNWPLSMMTTVEFTSEEEEETRVTVTWEPNGMTTVSELEAFLKERSGMTKGWTGSFDKLEDYIKSQ